jgi:glutamate transport system substrate-binding protein
MRITRLAAVVLAGSLALSAAACGDDETTTKSALETLKSASKVKVGIKFDQPLFGLKNATTGDIEGFDAEVAKLVVGEITGDASKVEFIETISANRETFLQDGTVDLVVATYTINDTRKEKVGFAGPYYLAHQDLLIKASDTSITKVQDLNGKNVCSVKGSTSAKNVVKPENAPQAKLVELDKYSLCVEELKKGRVVAVTTDDSILAGFAAADDTLKVLGAPFSDEPYGIGTKKESTDVREAVNAALEKIIQDGRWQTAWDSTVGKGQDKKPDKPTINRY